MTVKENRVDRVLDGLAAQHIEQMLITDPASIFYLTGKWIEPGERMLVLYISADGNHKLFVNRLFTVEEDLGVEKVWFSDTDDGVAILARAVDRAKPLGIDKTMEARFLLRLMELGGAASYHNTSVAVDLARSCKDAEEQRLMKEASAINDAAMARFRELIVPGVTERQVSDQLEAIYKELGADGHSFPPLVAFGPHAAIGHFEGADRVLQPGDCVLLDVGCRKDFYCADMTRTFFWQQVSEAHRKVYELVLRANETAEAMIRPGVRFCDIDKAARDVIAGAGYGEYFTHRLGHSIGIQVHEYGDVSQANDREVEPGMIFSIEPGIYLPGDVGVRIEDLVMVMENGMERLNHYPKELQILS